MARMVAFLALILAALALAAACDGEGDFLFEEEPEATGTPPFFQRTPLPSPEPSPTPTALTAEGTPTACGETYTIESGDSPFAIADKCGVDPGDAADWADELLELNGIDDPTKLKVGQELDLPPLPSDQ